MKKLSLMLVFLVLGVFLLAGSTYAYPFGSDNGSRLQGVLNNITTAPTAGASSVNVTTDYISDNGDSYWNITATGGSVATMIIELAGYANVNNFGIYDLKNPGQHVILFDGAATSGSQALLVIKADGSVFVNLADTGIDIPSYSFGYFLDSSKESGGGLFYSDTFLNTDNVDHMLAYQGTNTDTVQLSGFAEGLWTNNEYVMAWEDLYGGGDRDYEDMVVMVESVNPAPVPEPATMLLLGVGLCGLAFVGRKKLIKQG